jgi:hypothetical protein
MELKKRQFSKSSSILNSFIKNDKTQMNFDSGKSGPQPIGMPLDRPFPISSFL